jgi:hypothetical protein
MIFKIKEQNKKFENVIDKEIDKTSAKNWKNEKRCVDDASFIERKRENDDKNKKD